MEPSPGFWGQLRGDPCETQSDKFVLLTFLREQSLDIGNLALKSPFWPWVLEEKYSSFPQEGKQGAPEFQ